MIFRLKLIVVIVVFAVLITALGRVQANGTNSAELTYIQTEQRTMVNVKVSWLFAVTPVVSGGLWAWKRRNRKNRLTKRNRPV